MGNRTCPNCGADVGKEATEYVFNVLLAKCPNCWSELISASEREGVFHWHCWNRKNAHLERGSKDG